MAKAICGTVPRTRALYDVDLTGNGEVNHHAYGRKSLAYSVSLGAVYAASRPIFEPGLASASLKAEAVIGFPKK